MKPDRALEKALSLKTVMRRTALRFESFEARFECAGQIGPLTSRDNRCSRKEEGSFECSLLSEPHDRATTTKCLVEELNARDLARIGEEVSDLPLCDGRCDARHLDSRHVAQVKTTLLSGTLHEPRGERTRKATF